MPTLRISHVLNILICGLCISCGTKTTNLVQVKNTITIPIDDHQLRLSFVSDDIVRVEATNQKSFPELNSLMLDERLKYQGNFEVKDSLDFVVARSKSITVLVDKKMDVLSFYDDKGRLKLSEKSKSRLWESSHLGQWSKVGQTFESPEDEALYGLGQHQHGYMNYKGKDVDLTQHNIVAVVPFLYSSKNYGLLWDNYSITRFGDPRPYEQIENLKLSSANGLEEGLTEIWLKGGKEVARKQVNTIDYQYLETPGYEALPKSNEVDKIIFEGKMNSAVAGRHKFLLYASSYFKVWVNGELIFDKWRQNWNPWSNPFEVMMEANKPVDLRIEWQPNGGYMSLTHLDPMGDEDQNKIRFTSDAGKKIDYYFVNGDNADEIIAGYRQLTGKSSMLPKSAYGFWQSRERYKTQEELLQAAATFRAKNIPIDNIVLDWNYWPESAWGSHEFDSLRFPSPESMNESLAAQNIDVMISVWPKYYEGIQHYEEMKAKGYLFLNNIEKKRIDWIGKGYHNTFYDPFNSGARDMFWQQIDEHLYSKGFHRWWLDATEPDMHSNLSILDRIENMKETAIGPGEAYFNAYSLMNSKGVYEGQLAAHPDQRPFILTRSAFAGQQRYGSVTWSGDIVSRWSDLQDQIAAGINFSLSGIPNWTMDIGGFAVEDRFARDGERTGETLEEWRELNARWFQFGAFCPLFRSHGQYPFREIYNIAPESHPAYQSMMYYNKLRYRLMPYIYSMAAQTHMSDFTMMRGLVMDFGADPQVFEIKDQYMFGKDIMVCPVTGQGLSQRNVYLPKGSKWYDFYTGKSYEGGQTIIAPSPYERMPLFVKAGAIIAMGEDIQSTKDAHLKKIDLYVFGGADGATLLYDDGGRDMSFEKGNYTRLDIQYSDGSNKLKINNREGQYIKKGEEQRFNVILIKDKTDAGIDIFTRHQGQTIVYNGTKIEVALD